MDHRRTFVLACQTLVLINFSRSADVLSLPCPRPTRRPRVHPPKEHRDHPERSTHPAPSRPVLRHHGRRRGCHLAADRRETHRVEELLDLHDSLGWRAAQQAGLGRLGGRPLVQHRLERRHGSQPRPRPPRLRTQREWRRCRHPGGRRRSAPAVRGPRKRARRIRGEVRALRPPRRRTGSCRRLVLPRTDVGAHVDGERLPELRRSLGVRLVCARTAPSDSAGR